MADQFHVEVEGLKKLRKDLKGLDKSANRELSGELKEALVPLTARAAMLAPKRTGRFAKSLRPFAVGAKVGIRSRLPQGNVLHWGGTINPSGHDITFKPSLFISKAVEEQEERIVDAVGDGIENAARKNGWR